MPRHLTKKQKTLIAEAIGTSCNGSNWDMLPTDVQDQLESLNNFETLVFHVNSYIRELVGANRLIALI